MRFVITAAESLLPFPPGVAVPPRYRCLKGHEAESPLVLYFQGKEFGPFCIECTAMFLQWNVGIMEQVR